MTNQGSANRRRKAPPKGGVLALLAVAATTLWTGFVFVSDSLIPHIETVKTFVDTDVLGYFWPAFDKDAQLTIFYSNPSHAFDLQTIKIHGYKNALDISGEGESDRGPLKFNGRHVGDYMSIWYYSENEEKPFWGEFDLKKVVQADPIYYSGTVTQRTCANFHPNTGECSADGEVTCPAVLSVGKLPNAARQEMVGRACIDTNLSDLVQDDSPAASVK